MRDSGDVGDDSKESHESELVSVGSEMLSQS
jgi:hypothetical protein